jgi:hypothetical protein
VSISPTFYEQPLHQNPFAKKLQTQTVSTQKAAQKTLVYKAPHKIKVTPDGLSVMNYFKQRHIQKRANML